MLRKFNKAVVSAITIGLLTFAASHTTLATESANKQSVSKQETTLSIHFPRPIRKDIKKFINKDFTAKTGHQITTYIKTSGVFSRNMLLSIEKNELQHSVVMSYGRTGEVPPGSDIFEHLDNSRHLMKSMPKYLELRSEFAHFNDPEGHLHYPFVETMVIFYNPELIKKQDVPESWAALGSFSEQIAVPGRGCYAIRTLSSLYHTTGKDVFEKIIINAKMPKLLQDKSDKKAVRPLTVEGATKAIINGEFKVGVGALTGKQTLQAISDGKLGVIWPEEGAFALPYSVAVKSNPEQAELDLFNYITKDADLQKQLVKLGLSSTLSGGKVNPVVEKNNFKYNFISIETLMKKDVHQYIIDLVAKHDHKP